MTGQGCAGVGGDSKILLHVVLSQDGWEVGRTRYYFFFKNI